MAETTERNGRVTVTAWGLTDPGKVRGNNEDAFLITPLAVAGAAEAPAAPLELDVSEDALLLAVSDGMGGADAGEVASALVLEALREAMRAAVGDWDEGTKRAVEQANRAVWDAAQEPGKQGMGATLTAVCVHGNHAHIAEVGDSRAYLLRGGRLRQVTRDQSFVQFLVDAGALRAEEVDSYPMKNVVLQAMGQSPEVQVALGRLELRSGDRLLLCSDGLSGMVGADEMRTLLERADDVEETCRALVSAANANGGEDNVTVVVATVSGEGVAVPAAADSLTHTFQVLAEYKAAIGRDSGLGDDDDDEPWSEPAAGDDPGSAEGEGVRVDTRGAPRRASRPRAASSLLPSVALAVAIGLLVMAVWLLLSRR